MSLEVFGMWGNLALIGGILLLVILVSWMIRRYQRDIDDYEKREYRDPPVFGWPDGGP
jgi:flagellar biogenesis protein FliO